MYVAFVLGEIFLSLQNSLFIAKSINDVIGTTNFKGDHAETIPVVGGQRRHASDIPLANVFPGQNSKSPSFEKSGNDGISKENQSTNSSSNSSLVDHIDYVLSRTSTTGSLISNTNNSDFSKSYVHRTVHEKPIHHMKGAAAKIV